MDKMLTAEQAIAMIPDGSTIMIGEFGLRGCPDDLVDALAASGKKDLTIISNDLGSPGIGLGQLMSNHQVKKLIGSHYNKNPMAIEAYNAGEIEIQLLPQGTFAEAIRAGGMGIPAFYTPTGVGTTLAEGKEERVFDGRTYILERALHADFALVKAQTADKMGNLIYHAAARNFNPMMAIAATCTIAQVDEVVEVGALKPDTIITPHIVVNAIVKRGAEA